jgi:hypothetical protein
VEATQPRRVHSLSRKTRRQVHIVGQKCTRRVKTREGECTRRAEGTARVYPSIIIPIGEHSDGILSEKRAPWDAFDLLSPSGFGTIGRLLEAC